MEAADDALERYRNIEVPTGPWEEDENEDCAAYHSDVFRMFLMKILPCYKRYCHDWTICPFAHPGEKARRRDPRTINYAGIACPEMKRANACRRGSSCPYAHTVFEYWLHPSRYRTQMCKDGAACQRRVCFFAHNAAELRSTGTKASSAGAEGSSAEDLEAAGEAALARSPTATSEALTDAQGLQQGHVATGSSFSSDESPAAAARSTPGAPGTSGSLPLEQGAEDYVRVRDMAGALVNMRDSKGESATAVDLNEVIDMLSSLLRGGGTSSEAASGSAETGASSTPRRRPSDQQLAPSKSSPQMSAQGSATRPPQASRSRSGRAPAQAPKHRRGGAALQNPRGMVSRRSSGGTTGLFPGRGEGDILASGPLPLPHEITEPPPPNALIRSAPHLEQERSLHAFPESEDSDELSERMHMLSTHMAPSQHPANLARRLQAHRQSQSARTTAEASQEALQWQQRMQQPPQQPGAQLTPQQMQILARANTQPSSQLMMQMSPQTSAHAPGTRQSSLGGSQQLHPVYSAPSHTGGPPPAPTHSHALDTFLSGSIGQAPAGPTDFATLRTLSAAMQLQGYGGSPGSGLIDPAMAQLPGSGLTAHHQQLQQLMQQYGGSPQLLSTMLPGSAQPRGVEAPAYGGPSEGLHQGLRTDPDALSLPPRGPSFDGSQGHGQYWQ
ncbi:hypothetical protein WJX73_010416 [Symbiochloris irregularis]|uniref:C3H1-type domain-containing protein n=1 Tax=Symbiochloris irregularis TaxID=706552 RepID=A0AAW1NQW9_9CHLO